MNLRPRDVAYYQMRMKERAEGKCAALTAVYQGKQAGYVYLFLEAEEGEKVQ